MAQTIPWIAVVIISVTSVGLLLLGFGIAVPGLQLQLCPLGIGQQDQTAVIIEPPFQDPYWVAGVAPFNPRPHWGKLFTISPAQLQSLYVKLPDFQQLLRSYDPQGKFRNAFLDYLYERKTPCEPGKGRTPAQKGSGFQELARAVEANLDLEKVWRMLGLD